MPLPLPTVEYVVAYAGPDVDLPDSDDPEVYVQGRIQAAADLLAFASGAFELPVTGYAPRDQALARLVTAGIADMAVYLIVNGSEIAESYSPYTSERIGSYSYSKALKSKALAGVTEVVFYDQAVAQLLASSATSPMGNLSTGGEQVFAPGAPFSAWGGQDPGYGGAPSYAWPPR